MYLAHEIKFSFEIHFLPPELGQTYGNSCLMCQQTGVFVCIEFNKLQTSTWMWKKFSLDEVDCALYA